MLNLNCVAQQADDDTIKAIPTLNLQGGFYLDVMTMAQLLELSPQTQGAQLILQGKNQSLVLEVNSPDVIWRQGSEAEVVALAAPIQRKNSRWFAPPELFALFDVDFSKAALIFPDGTRYPLSPVSHTGSSVQAGYASIIDLGNSVLGLNFYSSTSTTSDVLSLMLVDISLIALADPEQRQEIDAFMATIREGRPLYMIVASLEPSPWESTLTFSQGAEQFIARYPLAISLLSGSKDHVTPHNPVVGVVVLPQTFNLREAMTVSWQGISQRITFR